MIAFFVSSAQTIDSSFGLEPKNEFYLNINGKTILVNENEELKLDTIFLKPTISIKLSDRKRFDNKSVMFQYPSYYSFEFESDLGYKNWTFSGNNIVVMFFEFTVKVPLSEITDGMVEKFGKQNCTVSPFSKKLGKNVCNGKNIRVSIGGELLSVDYYDLGSKGGKSRFIAFQNSLQEDGSSTEEYIKGFEMINPSINY
jgi:hypothetical protein